jgi:hypothetical protein
MLHASLQRQLTDLVTWASSRTSQLDEHQDYETSYALTQEFREWILCLEQHPELLDPLLLPMIRGRRREETAERPGLQSLDGLLEI